MNEKEPLIPKHGGYRKLKSFQMAQLVYDVTVRFCNCYINKRSRTHDQMVQAARSGVQNIAEGSQASGTSKKFELKLTNVARASLEELKLDYEDFLRQRGLPTLRHDNPVLIRFKEKRCTTLEDVQQWVAEEHKRRKTMDDQGQTPTNITPSSAQPMTASDGPCPSVPVSDRPCPSLSYAALAANAALSLLNLTCYFLDRQIERLAKDFENEGGFTERLYRIRSANRKRPQ
jgi:four helix bundle suffix protein